MSLLSSLIGEVREVSRGEPVAVAFSGGLDSSVAAALCREALGPDRVLLVTVNMGQYAYRRGNEIVLEMAERLGLPQRCLLGQAFQDRIMAGGPACNRCTREIKLGLVKAAARGRLVVTGANRSDTWGRMGVKLCNGFYAPLLDLDKPQIRELALQLGIDPPLTKIGENPGREGCKLKHLLKPLANPDYHGRAVAQANEVVLEAVRELGFAAQLANVKVIGPLRRNVGLVNLWPHPPGNVAREVLRRLRQLPELEEVHLVDRPVRLVAKANPSVVRDPHARYWLQHGRLQPDFAYPIEVRWLPSCNGRLATFHVVAFEWLEAVAAAP